MGDGVSLPIPPQFGCDECILTHITLYLNQKGGKGRAKLVGSSWYLTPLLWDTPDPLQGCHDHTLESVSCNPVIQRHCRTFTLVHQCLVSSLNDMFPSPIKHTSEHSTRTCLSYIHFIVSRDPHLCVDI